MRGLSGRKKNVTKHQCFISREVLCFVRWPLEQLQEREFTEWSTMFVSCLTVFRFVLAALPELKSVATDREMKLLIATVSKVVDSKMIEVDVAKKSSEIDSMEHWRDVERRLFLVQENLSRVKELME